MKPSLNTESENIRIKQNLLSIRNFTNKYIVQVINKSVNINGMFSNIYIHPKSTSESNTFIVFLIILLDLNIILISDVHHNKKNDYLVKLFFDVLNNSINLIILSLFRSLESGLSVL